MTHEEFLAYLETHPERRERWELLKKCMMQSRAEGMLYPEYQRMTDEEYAEALYQNEWEKLYSIKKIISPRSARASSSSSNRRHPDRP